MKLKLACLLLLTASINANAISYLCVADMATGFSFNEVSKRWSPANFNVGDSKYVVSPITDTDKSRIKAKWKVTQIGKSYTRFYCKEGFGEGDTMFCRLMEEFRINKTEMRYLVTSNIGYWDFDNSYPDSKEGANTPYQEVGKCSEIP